MKTIFEETQFWLRICLKIARFSSEITSVDRVSSLKSLSNTRICSFQNFIQNSVIANDFRLSSLNLHRFNDIRDKYIVYIGICAM